MSFGRRQIEAHAASAWSGQLDAPVVAFHLKDPPRHTGAVSVQVGEDTVTANVVWAASDLAMRFALRNASLEAPLVLFTPLTEPDLAVDVRIRLKGRRLRTADPWEAARGRFKALSVAPRLRATRALAEALLAIDEDRWFEAAPGGTVTESLAWRALLGWLTDGGLPAPEGALRDEQTALLLRASPTLITRSSAIPNEVRDALVDWLHEQHGRVGRIVGRWARYGDANAPRQLLTTAVVAEAAAQAARAAEGGAATLAVPVHAATQRLHSELDARALGSLGRAAASWYRYALRGEGRQDADRVVAEAATELDALGARAMWPWSSLSDAGFDGACARLSASIEAALVAATAEQPASEEHATTVLRAVYEIEHHALASRHTETVETAKAMARLAVRALETPAQDAAGTALARAHVADGAWVDLLRHRLDAVHATASLEPAAMRLRLLWHDRVARINAAFAAAVADAAADGDVPAGLLAQESVLDQVVAPLVRNKQRVLLLVMDGMSVAIARRLAAEVSERWDCDAWAPARGAALAPMLTVLPSVTEHARFALLTGQRGAGGQDAEAKGLKLHLGLQKAGATTALMHKGELDAMAPDALIARVQDASTKVLACVVNAVDDQLSGSSQLAVDWTIDRIRPLRTLLDSAFESGRVVVFTSDHGHVWNRASTEALPNGTAARWRPDGEALAEGETRLAGPRVRAVTGHDAIVVPHREDVRYSKAPAAGYHGGLTLQEAIAPLFVFAPDRPVFEGWDAARVELAPPAWWRLDAPVAADVEFERTETAVVAAVPSPAVAEEPPAAQTSLLGLDAPAPAPEPPAPREIKAPPAVEALFATQAFRDAVARVVPRESEAQRLRDLLAALAQRGGRAPVRALAGAIGMLERRMPGFVAKVAPVVNLDGYQAMYVDRVEQVVVLEVEQVCRQYGVTFE